MLHWLWLLNIHRPYYLLCKNYLDLAIFQKSDWCFDMVWNKLVWVWAWVFTQNIVLCWQHSSLEWVWAFTQRHSKDLEAFDCYVDTILRFLALLSRWSHTWNSCAEVAPSSSCSVLETACLGTDRHGHNSCHGHNWGQTDMVTIAVMGQTDMVTLAVIVTIGDRQTWSQ